jgi:hypothetical protein
MCDLAFRNVEDVNVDVVSLHDHVTNSLGSLGFEGVLTQVKMCHPCVFETLVQFLGSISGDVVGLKVE